MEQYLQRFPKIDVNLMTKEEGVKRLHFIFDLHQFQYNSLVEQSRMVEEAFRLALFLLRFPGFNNSIFTKKIKEKIEDFRKKGLKEGRRIALKWEKVFQNSEVDLEKWNYLIEPVLDEDEKDLTWF